MGAARTPEEIRRSIEANRVDLGVAVERLRGEVTKAADWRAHIERHRNEVIAGAGVAGFLLGGGIPAVIGLVTGRRRSQQYT